MASYNGTVKAKVPLDKAGRIVLPKAVRDELNLSPGDILELETSGANISLHAMRPTSALRKERGVWVYKTGEALSAATVEDTRRKVLDERYRAALGQDS